MKGSIVRFSNGVIVDLRPCVDGKPALALIDGVWAVAEGNTAVPWDDLKYAKVLSAANIAGLPGVKEVKQKDKCKRKIKYFRNYHYLRSSTCSSISF